MNRSERRKNGNVKKVPTYNFTEEQLQNYLKEYYENQLEEIRENVLVDAMILTLTLPIKVLIEDYWPKSYHSKIPGFVKHVLDYFSKWENGELDIEDLKKDLWEYGGVRFERND